MSFTAPSMPMVCSRDGVLVKRNDSGNWMHATGGVDGATCGKRPHPVSFLGYETAAYLREHGADAMNTYVGQNLVTLITSADVHSDSMKTCVTPDP